MLDCCDKNRKMLSSVSGSSPGARNCTWKHQYDQSVALLGKAVNGMYTTACTTEAHLLLHVSCHCQLESSQQWLQAWAEPPPLQADQQAMAGLHTNYMLRQACGRIQLVYKNYQKIAM